MKVLTVNEVATILEVNRDTVYKKARSGEIPGIRIGRVWRFYQDVLDEWLRKKSGKEIGAWRKQEKKVKDRRKEENPLIGLVGLFGSTEKNLAEKHDKYIYSPSKKVFKQ